MMHFPDSFPTPVIHIRETNSTNSYLNDLCKHEQQAEFTTVVSEFQIAGRGQRGNSWESEGGKNLLFSFVVFPDFLVAKQQFLLSQIISLAIKEELDTSVEDISIKWPNDIYWKKKKIAGILIENYLAGDHIQQSIAGVGININQQEFFSPAPNPVSLKQITGQEQDAVKVLSGIMLRMKQFYKQLQQGQTEFITSRYLQALFRKDGLHQFRDINGDFKAAIEGVEPGGELILKDETGKKRNYLFKEVEFRIND